MGNTLTFRKINQLFYICTHGEQHSNENNISLEDLFELNIDLNTVNSNGNTPLQVACDNGWTTVVEKLIENGVNITFQDNSGKTALYYASMHGFLDIVRILVIEYQRKSQVISTYLDVGIHQHGNHCRTRHQGDTSLFVASSRENGKNRIQHKYKNGTCVRDYPGVVQLLIEFGALVNIKCSNGNTALHTASKFNCIESTKILILNRAELDNQNDNEMYTALHMAVMNKSLETTRILIKSGANNDIQDFYGYTALHNAVNMMLTETIRLLIEFGCDINIKNCKGDTALHDACSNEFIEGVRILLNSGADVTILNNKNKTARSSTSCPIITGLFDHSEDESTPKRTRKSVVNTIIRVDDCPVCMNSFEGGENTVRYSCGHYIHSDCYSSLIASHPENKLICLMKCK
ncbi:MAG: ankyrin repeat domain-containing protein [Colwellia sp.]|nr:ankyrin repeat domain-containing protein [Colwellia sp.]